MARGCLGSPCKQHDMMMIMMCLPTSPHEQDVTQRQFFKRSLFSLTGYHAKVKESSVPCCLPIRKKVGFISFSSVLAPCEMQAASSKI